MVLPQILFVCDLKPHAIFWEPYDNPFREKSNPEEREKERKKHR